jgi:CheY-like chemotaxis protein
VLVNLISNAKDATAGEPNRKIDVSVSYEEGHIKLAITDNGCGVLDEIKEKIFEPFFTTKKINQGTGIGLSIVRTIIEEHEGKLELNSKAGAGSTFTVLFPVTFGQAVMAVNAHNGSITTIQEKIPCNVLIVDDEEDLREIFQFILSKICSTVVVAESAQAGYEIVAQGKIDIVISDIRMPVQDGFDLFRMIRQNKKITQPKFVFLTGGVQMSEEELQIIQSQSDGLLTKPLVRDDISKKIRGLFPERVSKK